MDGTLYDLTLSQAAETIVEDVVEHFGVKKSLAKKLVANSLIYCCVQEEIMGQIDFLLNRDY